LQILYFFYKVSLIGWIAFCCNAFTFFSGQPLYNDWYASFYNTAFTAIPICIIGIIDQDVSAAECVKYPQLYRGGHRKEYFNMPLLLAWMANSLYTGIVIFFFPAALYWLAAFRPGGQIASVDEFGALLFTCLVIVPNVQLVVAITYFTWVHHVTIWGSIILWYVFLIIFGALPVSYSSTAHKTFLEAVAPSGSYWLMQLLVVVACLLPDFVFRAWKNAVRPSDHHIVTGISRRESRDRSRQS
jgi:phospholipid-translocating ATPase